MGVEVVNGTRRRYGPHSPLDLVESFHSMEGEVHTHVVEFSYTELPTASEDDNVIGYIPDNSFILSAHLYAKVGADGADPTSTGTLVTSDAVTVATADDSYAGTGLFQPLIDAGATVGDTLTVAGFTNAGNNGTVTIVTITADKITVSENLTDEAAGQTATFALDIDEDYLSIGLANTDGTSLDPDGLLVFTDLTDIDDDVTWHVGAGAQVGAAITDDKVVVASLGLPDYQTITDGKFKLVIQYLIMAGS